MTNEPLVAETHLPRYATPIVGRSRELDDVEALIERSHVVTVVGTGGIGKTRLAVEVALGSPLLSQGAVWFVDLGPIGDAALLPSVIAGAIGLELAPTSDLGAALVASLRPERGLIVLDNCEHVLESAASIAAALARECPNVRVLATSREPLGIEGEAVYRLGTLDGESSATLFAAHARSADRSFSTEGRNATQIREICKQLDGMALAIELAAACVGVMSLSELRKRLGGRFRLMAKHRTAPLARHETMLALIDWSYDLLSPQQQKSFVRAAVFNGSFSRDSAIVLAGADDVDELAKKSMFVVDAEGAHRYRMLESIRAYALDRLRTHGEEHALRAAHAGHFARVAAQARDGFGRGSEEAWLARFAPDLDNFRAALEWSVVNDVSLASGLAVHLSEFWEYVNLAAEGMRRSETILAALDDGADAQAVPVLLAVAKTALAARIYRRSLETADRALELAEHLGDQGGAAEARRIAGRSRYLVGIESDRSLRDLRRALEYFRAHDDPFATARATRDYASALAQTDPELGRRLLLEALGLARSLDWPRLTIHIEINVAEREFRSGNSAAAVERAREVIAMLRKRRSPVQLGHALTNLASYLTITGEYDATFEAAREAIAIGRAHEASNYIAYPLQALAIYHLENGRAPTAARLLGYVDAYYDRYSMKRELTEAIVQRRLIEGLRARLNDVEYQRDVTEGRALSDEAAVALGLGE